MTQELPAVDCGVSGVALQPESVAPIRSPAAPISNTLSLQYANYLMGTLRGLGLIRAQLPTL
jgi:hypothetical protein